MSTQVENNEELSAAPVVLQDEIETENEEEYPPPEEENEAQELNLGNIFAVIFIFIAVVLVVILTVSGKDKKTKSQNKALDKAGSKYEIEFDEKTNSAAEEIIEESFGGGQKTEEDSLAGKDEENVDDIINALPPEYRLPQQPPPSAAPVTPVGSSGTYKSDRPDTRSSKSPRTIAGLKGQNYTGGLSNSDTIANVLNGTYNGYQAGNGYGTASGGSGATMSKDEYMNRQISLIKDMQSNYGANGSMNPQQYYQGNKESFYNQTQTNAGTGQYLSYNSLWDGTIISGALETAINTNNPGIVKARVTENVYSSYDHSFLLIPEGSMLYATYNSSVSYGQKEVQVIWNLLIRPDGYRIQLGNMNGVNAQGASGYAGKVSNHPFETLKALGLVAVFSVIQTEITGQIDTANNTYAQNAMSDVYAEVSKLGNKILDKALDIKPTITIKEGTEIKLITNVPLELPPVEMQQANRKYVRTR